MIPFGFAAFLLFGVCLVLVGANQAELARDLQLDLAQSGLLGASLALGIGVGVVASGPLADRLPRRPLFVASALLAGISLLCFSPDMGFARAATQLALVGLGIGVHETLINTAVADRFGPRATKPLVLVHAAATLGAVLAPWAIGWLAGRVAWTASFHLTGAGELLLAAVALAVPLPPPRARSESQPRLRRVLTPSLLPFLVVGFAYVGVEATLTLFAVPYAATGLGLGEGRGLAAISAFWLGLLLGRLGLLAVRREIDARFLLAAGWLGALVLGIGIGSGVSAIAPVFGLAGVALGFVFPVMIALAARRFPEAPGTATGLVAGAGALGGFVVPWLHGAIGDLVGVAAALQGLTLWCAALALAAWAAGRERRS